MKDPKEVQQATAVAGHLAGAAPAVPAPAPSVFEGYAEYRRLQQRKVEAASHRVDVPFFVPHDGVNGSTIDCGGSECINFSGYNYIGLNGHPQVSEAAKRAIDRFGTSASASRIVSGQIPLHGELEREIADFLGVEDALVFVSGYGANVSTIGFLFGRHDLVVHDALAHNSILTGCQLSGAKRMSFRHNDWDDLEALLAAHRSQYKRVLIAIESVYSMDGDIADLRQAIALKEKYDAILMVDEAHSLGVLGETGRGIGEYFDIERHRVDIWMGTLSKSLASCGGYIAGSSALVDLLRFLAPGFIYSVGLSPPDTAAALTALTILKREPDRVERLRRRSDFFLAQARAHGLDTGSSEGTPVVPLIVGSSLGAMRLSQQLRAAGIHVQPIVYPAVAEISARLRFFITTHHSEEQIAHTVATVAEEWAKLKAEGTSGAR